LTPLLVAVMHAAAISAAAAAAGTPSFRPADPPDTAGTGGMLRYVQIIIK
jgi:hypothetical protein